MRRLLIVLIIIAIFMFYRDWQQRPVTHPPGILVPLQPVQKNLANSVSFEFDEFAVTPRAEFDIQARLLSRERYFIGMESGLSPIDLALGWARMSDQSITDQIEIRQSGRWYYTRYKLPPPLPAQEIVRNSANMHMIPATDSIEKELKSLRPGEVVRLRGFLVDVDHPSGWKWRTSLTREDTGQGACELVYVEEVVRLTKM
ncbi:MAG: hypothetical protein ACR2QG_12055 [Gammaproteobacteria bacterium]